MVGLGKDDEEEDDETGKFFCGVNIRRLGDFVFPVEVEFVFEDGEVRRDTWDGRELWKKFRFTSESKLVSARVDPDFKVPLDIDLTNNSKTVEPDGFPVRKQAVTWLYRFQFLLDFMGI